MMKKISRTLNPNQTNPKLTEELKQHITTIYEMENFEIYQMSFSEFLDTKICRVIFNKNYFGKKTRFTPKSHKSEFDKLNGIIKLMFELNESPDFKSVVIKRNELLFFRKENWFMKKCKSFTSSSLFNWY